MYMGRSRQEWMFIHICLCTQLWHGIFFWRTQNATSCWDWVSVSCPEHGHTAGNANGCCSWQNTQSPPDMSVLMNVFWAGKKPTVCWSPLQPVPPLCSVGPGGCGEGQAALSQPHFHGLEWGSRAAPTVGYREMRTLLLQSCYFGQMPCSLLLLN